MSVIAVEQLQIGYRNGKRPPRVVAENLNATVKARQLVCLLGPNGAGKSTLLRTLTGIQPALAGRVLVDGQDVARLQPSELARKLSVVLTDRVTAGILSAYDLVALGRQPWTGWTGKLSPRDHAVVQRAMAAVGADMLADRNVGELSDGERQRVLLARALAQEPRLLVLDEVTAFLDLPRRVDVIRTLRGLAHGTDRAILLSTHDLDLALRSADRIWLLSRSGVLHTGTPEELVLDGSFAEVFAAEGVRFRHDTGAFDLHETAHISIRVSGEEGQLRNWTCRAMERLGYQVTDATTCLMHMSVEAHDGVASWILMAPGVLRKFESLSAASDYLTSSPPKA